MVLERKGGGYSFDGWFRITPPNVQVFNPAFDITPGELITAIITERGPIRPEPNYRDVSGAHVHDVRWDARAHHRGFAGAMKFPADSFGDALPDVIEDGDVAESPTNPPRRLLSSHT